tara:strand:- start:64 stop:483 length:420 start_codon:yes stop_codon:yes gene_type:complete
MRENKMQYDNTNKGALWNIKEDYKVVKNGTINMDGNDRRVIAVSRKNARGEPIISLYEEIGNLKKNESDNEKSPTAKGILDVRKLESTKSVGVWKRNKKDGEEFWSVSISDYSTGSDTIQTQDLDNTTITEDLDDEIPF